MKKRFLAILAIALAVCTCLPLAVHAAEKIEISSAKSDSPAVKEAARAECAVENLRPTVEGGLWYMGNIGSAPDADSLAESGQRYLTLALKNVADISSIKIQWYQGGSSATDITAVNNRNYHFWIEASADGTTFTGIYHSASDPASSGTGKDFEEYQCSFANAKAIRIWGTGSTGDANPNNDQFFAIRNIEVYGTAKGANDYTTGSDSAAAPKSDTTDTGATSGGTSGNTSGGTSATTGDFENILLFAGIAVVACAAVVIIRKKIRER